MVAIRAKQIFVNLPVQDLKKSVEFLLRWDLSLTPILRTSLLLV